MPSGALIRRAGISDKTGARTAVGVVTPMKRTENLTRPVCDAAWRIWEFKWACGPVFSPRRPAGRGVANVQRQREFSLVARGERHCDACNIDFDRDFRDAYALSGGERLTCARCSAPTAMGPIDNWTLVGESEWVEFVDN